MIKISDRISFGNKGTDFFMPREWVFSKRKKHTVSLLPAEQDPFLLEDIMPRWNNPNCGFQKDNKIRIGMKHTEATKKKMCEDRKGEKSYNWKGGITKNMKNYRRQQYLSCNGREYGLKYYHQNKQKYSSRRKILRPKKRKLWLDYLLRKNPNPKCEICGKSLIYLSGKHIESVNFDHRQNNISQIFKKPSNWFSFHTFTPENIKIWEQCNFGILCLRCNTALPTDNRKEWLEKVWKYVFKEVEYGIYLTRKT